MKYFNYEIHGELINAEYLHKNGFFVGNSQADLREEIKFLFDNLNGHKNGK